MLYDREEFMSDITVILPEGEARNFGVDVSVADALAELLSNKQRKQTVAIKIGDALADLSLKLGSLGQKKLELSPVSVSSAEGLDILRHSTAHLMAKAVLDLYGADVKVAIGPAIEDGFYYDFEREIPFTPEDFENIEAKMQETVKGGLPFERKVMEKEEAIAFFEEKGEHFLYIVYGTHDYLGVTVYADRLIRELEVRSPS